jgi:hypothetical protein
MVDLPRVGHEVAEGHRLGDESEEDLHVASRVRAVDVGPALHLHVGLLDQARKHLRPGGQVCAVVCVCGERALRSVSLPLRRGWEPNALVGGEGAQRPAVHVEREEVVDHHLTQRAIPERVVCAVVCVCSDVRNACNIDINAKNALGWAGYGGGAGREVPEEAEGVFARGVVDGQALLVLGMHRGTEDVLAEPDDGDSSPYVSTHARTHARHTHARHTHTRTSTHRTRTRRT